jgi:uncharacterized membrane protein YkgB
MKFTKLDQQIARIMNNSYPTAIRISFAIIFIWFGILKPLGHSAATPLVEATVSWMPFFDTGLWVSIIGWWEVIIGITFLFKSTTRIAIALLFLQMSGTFLPLILLPEITFQEGQFWVPTLIGQYIVKNLMILSAALVVGGSLLYAYKNQ